jgi:peroxiredoxin
MRAAAIPLFFVVIGAAGCATTDGAAGRLTPNDPTLAHLRDGAGQPLDLAEVARAHDATVLFFWATRCPCVVRYQERMLALRRAYPTERVAMLAVVSNADDDLAHAVEVARARGFTLPLVHDPGGRLARRLDARTTPTTVILDREGAVRFVGWIDNERPPGTRGRVAYVEEALGALLAGSAPPTARAPVYGCVITRAIAEAPACHGPQ